MDIRNIVIDEKFIGLRLDVVLADYFEGKSRAYLQGLIEKEKVKVNNVIKKSNYKLKENDEITIETPDPVELNAKPEDIPLDILYEDSDVIVINKPQGMVVHPASGNISGTLVNALLYHCTDLSGINGVSRPGIVHRIDKDTSGVIVVAKNDNAHNKLAIQFKEHSVVRIYIALTECVIKKEDDTINAPLGRHPNEKIKMAVVKDGKRAVTYYKVIERFKANTLIECKLETGRTHQIRVHLAYKGFPLVGDITYGFKKQRFNLKGQMLHAKKLGFIHPTTNEYMEFETPLPMYFEKIIGIIRNELKR
jgi:23S rRNA pseudouridine1911/1915/1917 synthase